MYITYAFYSLQQQVLRHNLKLVNLELLIYFNFNWDPLKWKSTVLYCEEHRQSCSESILDTSLKEERA